MLDGMSPSRALSGLILAAALLAGPPALAGEGKDKPKTSFVEVKPLAATLMRRGGRRGVLTVELGLDVPDAALRTRAEQSTPILRDAYVRVVQAYAFGLSPGATPSADFLAITLQRETDKVLKRPGARVLLGAVLAN
jgi:hypothetical protein